MTAVAILTIGLLLAIVLGLSVASSLGLVGLGLLAVDERPPWDVVGRIVWNTNTSFILIAVPLFILMGEILVRSGTSERLYSGLSAWVTRLPGGLLHSNIAASAAFAAVSGSSVATGATIGTVALPSFRRRNYNDKLVLGSLAAGGTLGILIPPSLTLIVYGVLMEESIGKLYVAAIIPGILTVIAFSAVIAGLALYRPSWAPREASVPWRKRFLALLDIVPVAILIVLVLGTIYLGLASPTEAAALGVTGAIGIALINRSCDRRMLREAAYATALTSAMMMLIVTAAFIVQFGLAILDVPDEIATFVDENLRLGPGETVLAILALYLVLGLALEAMPVTVATLPIILPILHAADVDLIWFAILAVKVTELGLISPPGGMNLFVLQSIRRRVDPDAKNPINDLFIGVTPFIIADLIVLALIFAFPAIVTWLPNTMK